MMLFLKKHFLFALWLLALCLPTTLLAVEDVDCINYSESPDGRCKYYRIWNTRGAQLYVVPPDSALIKKNAIKGASFYVYVPQEKQVGRDTLTLISLPDSADVFNLQIATADADSGLFNLRVASQYKLYNFMIGTSDDAAGSNPMVSLIYNFYVPYLKYYVKGEEILKSSKLSFEVGDTMKVDVEALIPIGPRKDRVDSTLKRTFYITAFGDSKNLEYYSLGGKPLKQSDGTVRLDVDNGKACFLVVATKAITDGSTFTLNAFDDGKDGEGNTKYILSEKFPGNFEFTNPGMPTLDGAAIYDTDGDGVGDSIATWFGGNMDSVAVKDFFYSWPKKDDYVSYGGDVKQDGSKFGLPDVKVELQKDSATGSVKAYVCTTVGNRCDTLKTALQDSIGAAIQLATLVKGGEGTDTLVVRFNKPMDPTWTEGRGLKLNGEAVDVKAIGKDGNEWVFVVKSGVVSVGDKLKIETICSSKECPDGILTAADGVATSKNNQEVVVQNAGRVFVDSDKNGFYDRNGDGRMDSVSVGFENPITEADLKNMEFTFYWLDNDGDLVAIKPNLSDLTISADGTVLGYALDPEKYNIKNMLTGIDKSYSKGGKVEYGYVTISQKLAVEDKETVEEASYKMNDCMAPVMSSTFLNPESFQRMEPDKFKVTFSEAIDYKNFDLTDDCLAFYVDGAWVHYNLSAAQWSDDGRTVTLFMEAGEDLTNRMNPADSIRFDNFAHGLVDKEGNRVSELSPAVMVEGDPRVIMMTSSFADLNKAAELSDRVKPFTIEHVESSKEAFDQSSLGVLMDVRFSTIMTKDSTGISIPDMKDIGLKWELYVYTNLGVYVGGASGKMDCNDPFFEGNCLENPDKLYVRWNMRADNGRKIGVGVYLAKFKIKVFGAKEDFIIERIFRWGISAKGSK